MFRFTPRTIPNQIVVVGCGGTGSRLVPLLTQFIAACSKDKYARGWLTNPTIFLIDDDVVEAKNLMRQNFVAADVGKHKASVLAQRYGRAYGVNVIPVLKRVTGGTDCFAGLPVSVNLNQSIVIMCVDSAQARRDIIATVCRLSSGTTLGQGAFFIDAGNEDNFGQVRFFNQALPVITSEIKKDKIPKNSPVILDTPAIPIDVDYYANLVDMPGQGSCADLDQTLAINAIMGAEIMGIVQNYFYAKPMIYNQVSISLDGARTTTYNTPADFIRRGKESTNAAVTAVGLRSFGALEVSSLTTNFIRETAKVMKAMEVSIVAETAVEDAPVIAKSPKRKKRAIETGIVSEEYSSFVTPVVGEPLQYAASDLEPL